MLTFLSSERVSNEMVDKFHEEVQNVYKQMMSKLKEECIAKDDREYKIACDEGTFRSPQKRKHNGLDY